MLEAGKMINLMASASKLIKMEVIMKEIMFMAKNKETGLLNGQMEANMWEIFIKE
jgi:hypothetical protein